MTMQTDLFAQSGVPEAIETTSIDVNISTGGISPRPLAVPCAFLNRANKPCQMLGKRPLMTDGKQMDWRGRPLIACDPYCFSAIEPAPASYADDDVADRRGTP